MTAAEEAAATNGIIWTEDELLFGLSQDVITPTSDTVTTVEAGNIIGRDENVIVGQAFGRDSVGSKTIEVAGGDVAGIASEDDKIALLAAEADDVLFYTWNNTDGDSEIDDNELTPWSDTNGNGLVDADEFNVIRYAVREDVDIETTGNVRIIAGTQVFVGSEGVLNLQAAMVSLSADSGDIGELSDPLEIVDSAAVTATAITGTPYIAYMVLPSGTFLQGANTSITGNSKVALGDVDGDGNANFNLRTTVHLADYLGGLGHINSSDRMEVAYLNDDRNHDLVITTNTGTLILFGDDEDGFEASGQIISNGDWRDMVVADLDDDGDLDLLVTRDADNQIWRNDGTGQFSLSQDFGDNGSHASLADVDFDGDVDAVVVNDLSRWAMSTVTATWMQSLAGSANLTLSTSTAVRSASSTAASASRARGWI